MIARHRGDHRIHSRWRPQPLELHSPIGSDAPAVPAAASAIADLDDRIRIPWRRLVLVISATLLTLAVVVGLRNAATSSSKQAHALPATPMAWVQEFTAAAIDDPSAVCRHLFAPALVAVFKADTGKSCLAYYAQVDSQSYRIRHTLQDGPTAAVEAQQLGHGRTFGYFTILLSRLPSGWQAIDIVPGGSIRPR